MPNCTLSIHTISPKIWVIKKDMGQYNETICESDLLSVVSEYYNHKNHKLSHCDASIIFFLITIV